MPNEKFVIQHKASAPKGRKREYPHIRISLSAYAHICEMADETGRTITDVASKAIEYAYSNLVYGIPAEPEQYYCDTPVSEREFTTDDPETVRRVSDIIRRAGLNRYELDLLLNTVQLLPDYTL